MKKILSIVLAVMMLASTVAISGIVSASAETTAAPVSVELIPAYGEKDLSIVSDTLVANEGVNEFSIVDTATLTGGEAGVPGDKAYYLKNNAKVNKTGMYFEINKEIWPVTKAWANKELYLEFWIWTSVKLTNPVLRMFPVKEANSGSYVEYAAMAFGDNSKWTTTAGWSRCIIKLDSGYAGSNAQAGKWYYEMMNEGIFRNIDFHDHSNAGADIAIAAVRLIHADSPEAAAQAPWGFEIESSRSHYYLNETPSKDDFTVKYQGQEVEDFTMSEIDTTTWGRKVITFTANGVSQKYYVQVKPRGNTFGDTWAELYGGKPDNGIGCALNNDNFRTGDQSMVFSGNNDLHYRTDPTEAPLDLTGEEYFEFWIYITADYLKTASTSAEFLIELSSNRNPTANTWRYHWKANANNYNLLQFNKGWQKVRIPLQKNRATGGDFDRKNNYIDNMVDQVYNLGTPLDFTEIDGMRIRTPNWPSDISGGLILVGGVGYGMDVSVNGQKWGDDLATAIKEAPAGATVKLENDVTIDETIVVDKKVYLDLNRFTLRSSADPIFKIVEGGNLRVVDNNNYLRASYGGVQKFQGDIISTTADASAFKMIGSTEDNGSSTILKVSEKIDIFADYGVDINLDTKAEGIYTSLGVQADLYGNFAPSGLSENNNCNVYINGLVQGDPIVNIYGGTYKVTDVSHFAVPGEGTINVMGGTFDGDLLAAGTTTTAEVKTNVYLFGNFTDKVDGLIIADGIWDIDVSGAKDIQGGSFLNDTYKNVIDVELNETDANDADMILKGNWTTLNNQKNANNKNLLRASKRGSTAEFTFTGSVLEIGGYKAPSYGKIQVDVIGKGAWVVDLYAEEAIWDAHLFSAVLGEGTHNIIVTVLDEKNAAATNKGLFYAALDTIAVDGAIVNSSADYVVENDIVLTKSSAVIAVENVFTNNAGEGAIINAVAQKGTVEVDGTNLVYTGAMATSDVITYELNGIKGVVNITFDPNTVFEAEDYLASGKGMYAWKFSGHNANILEAGESTEFTFTGSSISIIGYRSAKYGSFRLFIDGERVDLITEKIASGYEYQYGLGKWTVDEGTHTVKIVAVGKTLLDAFVIG